MIQEGLVSLQMESTDKCEMLVEQIRYHEV